MTISSADIVTALNSLDGVTDAGLEPDGDGPGVLRLSLTPGHDEVAVASQVGRLLREKFNLGVDADHVQLIEDAASGPVRVPGSRPVISRMQLISAGMQVSAYVTLTHAGRTVVGETAGSATQRGIHRAVANASLRALESLVGDRAHFELEHIDVSVVGTERTAGVTVTMTTSEGSDLLTGCAIVRDDARQAVIRAVMDAANRRLAPLLDEAV